MPCKTKEELMEILKFCDEKLDKIKMPFGGTLSCEHNRIKYNNNYGSIYFLDDSNYDLGIYRKNLASEIRKNYAEILA